MLSFIRRVERRAQRRFCMETKALKYSFVCCGIWSLYRRVFQVASDIIENLGRVLPSTPLMYERSSLLPVREAACKTFLCVANVIIMVFYLDYCHLEDVDRLGQACEIWWKVIKSCWPKLGTKLYKYLYLISHLLTWASEKGRTESQHLCMNLKRSTTFVCLCVCQKGGLSVYICSPTCYPAMCPSHISSF